MHRLYQTIYCIQSQYTGLKWPIRPFMIGPCLILYPLYFCSLYSSLTGFFCTINTLSYFMQSQSPCTCLFLSLELCSSRMRHGFPLHSFSTQMSSSQGGFLWYVFEVSLPPSHFLPHYPVLYTSWHYHSEIIYLCIRLSSLFTQPM